MKRIIYFFIFITVSLTASAQKYITKNGFISFFSSTPIEDIKADNNQVASVLDTSTGEVVFQVLIKAFQFKKALMQEHFNENYLESEKFPRSTFTGKIINLSSVSFTQNGKYDAKVEGDLTIHGVTRKVSAAGTIDVTTEGINVNSKFIVVPEDYKITIPAIMRDNIAKTIEVTVIMKYVPM